MYLGFPGKGVKQQVHILAKIDQKATKKQQNYQLQSEGIPMQCGSIQLFQTSLHLDVRCHHHDTKAL